MKLELTFLAALALSSSLLASSMQVREDVPAATPAAPQVEEDAFRVETKRYEAAVKAWRDERRAAAKRSAAEAAEVTARHPVREFWPRMETLAKDGDARALAWMVEASSDRFDKRADVVAQKTELVARLFESHTDEVWASTGFVTLLPRQRTWFDEAWVRTKLEELARKSTNKEVSAAAYYELVQRLSASKATAEDKQRAAELTAKLEADYAGTNAARQIAIQREASAYEVGGTPHDFEALDPDGVAFKLSDYRGKVVMLDFWGFW